MKKLLLAASLLVMGQAAFAASGVRGAKAYKVINVSASASGACLASGGGALYSVLASTGATSDYVVIRDSNTANTTSAEFMRVGLNTTSYTQVSFDPPVQFRNGISVNAPATIQAVTYTFECGRVTQGY